MIGWYGISRGLLYQERRKLLGGREPRGKKQRVERTWKHESEYKEDPPEHIEGKRREGGKGKGKRSPGTLRIKQERKRGSCCICR